MKEFKFFFKPPKELFQIKNLKYKDKYFTYSHYNYYSNLLISLIKEIHFNISLSLTQKFFNKFNVIDFGCADGIFLYALSKYFNNVTGIDSNPRSLSIAELLINKLNLKNVKVICNKDLSFNNLKNQIYDKKYHIAFVLEVLEHIGFSSKTMYYDKITFLNNIFSLLEPYSIIVISVPRMVGLPLLIQYIVFFIFRMVREKISFMDLIKLVIFKKNEKIEKDWFHKHIGFNHLKLQIFLKKHFKILKIVKLPFQNLYVIKSK
ncbi:MAG: class I SAM-dependent methyltransferase [Promethearchaeota archaeon]